MATKFIGVGLANDRKPGDVPAISEAGQVLVSVLSEGVLLPDWQDLPEPELTAPGDPGQVLFNDAGNVAGASLVAITDSGNGISATHFDDGGADPRAGTGFIRSAAGRFWYSLNADEDDNIPVIGLATDEVVEVGGALGVRATAFAGSGTVATAGTFRFGNDVGGAVGRTTGGDPVLVGGYIDGSNNSLYGRRTGPYVCAGNTAWWIDDAGTYYWRGDDGAADTDWMALSAAGVNLLGRLLIGVTNLGCESVNGAAVVAPVEGSAITTTATINVGQGNLREVTAASAYAITVHASTGSPYTGEGITFYALTALANAITITNGGAGGGDIGFSSGTIPAGFKGSFTIYFDGTDWAPALGSIYRVA